MDKADRMSINTGSARAKGKVCKTFTRRFDSDPRLQSKPHSDWPSGDFTPHNLDTLKTAQNGEDKPKPCAVRGQQRGQQRGQRPSDYESVSTVRHTPNANVFGIVASTETHQTHPKQAIAVKVQVKVFPALPFGPYARFISLTEVTA